jgi:hypothetical protein
VPSRARRESHAPLEFSPGQQIDRFELIRELARGGMGQVFLARDTKLGRKVAIKFLLQADPGFVQRFLIEARATARCTHENIVTIFEVGEHDGLPYMVLEFLEGKTLTDLLTGEVSPRQFVELVVPVVRALERAHEHGIVHRDLKPSNVFVTDRGVVKVLDFGVAKWFDERDVGARLPTTREFPGDGAQEPSDAYVTFSGGGSVVGTYPFMSPEQWGAAPVDHRSDLWAVGIMFWRALARVHPAGTMEPDKLRERLLDLDRPLRSLGARDPSMPPELVRIVDRCLAKRVADRYATAGELLHDLQQFLQPTVERIADDAGPFRGLAAFGEADAKVFFGRSSEIRTALGRLDGWPLLAVIGPSGVGKSSFVHAGLVPAVRASGGAWAVRVLRPGRNPLGSLAQAVGEAGDAARTLADSLRESPGLFGASLRREAAVRGARMLIVVDQLEELFTLSDDDGARQVFLAALLAAADDASAPVRIVLSMRADFLDRLANHKQFLAELSRGLFFLSAPDVENLREILVRPAELAGYAFERAEIVEDMLRAATGRGALPLLQFAATRLWDARDRSRRMLTAAAYQAMGGLGGAFARHADEIVAAVPSASHPLLKAVMTRLVTPEGTRAVIDRRELLQLADDHAEVARILDQLVGARLVNLNVDPSDHSTTVEIVHEVLIAEWPTLRRWLEDGQALRGFLHELRQAVRQWAARNKPDDLVWRGVTAREALAQLDRHVTELSPLEREFVAAVRAEARRARRRRVAVVASVVGVLAIVFAGGSVALLRISRAQKEAAAQAVAAQQEADKARSAEQKARAAEEEVSKQFALLKAESERRTQAEVARTTAEEAAAQANEAVKLSQEELVEANSDLKALLAESQADKAKAQRLAVAAEQAAETARRATEEAKSANAKLQGLLQQERDRVRKLEQEKSKIATGL